MNQPSVRQCGPRFATGVAREIRRALLERAAQAISAVFGPLERRRARLRRLEAERLVKSSMRQLEPIAICEGRSSSGSSRRLIVFVDGRALSIGWATFSIVTFPRGGYQVDCTLEPAARLSGHALERLILRLSTREWSPILRELSTLEIVCATATTAESRIPQALRVPTPHGALVVACDQTVPTIVTFLDDLSERKANLAAIEFSTLLRPESAAA